MFVVFEQLPEVGTGRIIRKVAVVPKDYSLTPTNPARVLTPAEHAMHGGPRGTPYLSGSSRPMGAASMTGEPLLIDLAGVRAAGGRVVTVPHLVADLRGFLLTNPGARSRVERLIWAIEKIEGEVLIQGSVPGDAVRRLSPGHRAYVDSAEGIWAKFKAGQFNSADLESALVGLEKAYRQARIIGRVGRVVTVVGVVLTVKDVADAAERSIIRRSFKPLGAEVFRQVMGWEGALAGMQIGGVVGASFGVVTGPGAVAFAACGAIVFGALGYFGADLVARATWGTE
jgi:hypothetical protein